MNSDSLDELFSDDGYKAAEGVMGMIYKACPARREEHQRYARAEAEAKRAERLAEYAHKFDEQRRVNGSRTLDEIMGY